MKKSLVALAALAATTAFAQSSVTLYGNLDQTLYHATNDGKSVNYTNSNGGTTSLWGIAGTEDLGGGIKAAFDLKSELTLTTGQIGSASTGMNTLTTTADNRTSGAFNRGAWIGLNTNAGNVKLGRQNDALWEQAGRFNNTGINSFGWNNLTAAATGFGATASSFNGVALTNSTLGLASYNPSGSGTALPFYAALSYETPVFNGFKAKVMSSPKGSYTQSAGDAKRSALSVTYDNGPVAVAYGQSYINGLDGATAAKVSLIAGSYTMGALKFNVGQQKTQFDGTWNTVGVPGHDLTVTGFGVTYTQGKWEYNAGYTTLKDDEDSTYKTTQTGLTARDNFSKRTSVYGGYGAGKNEGTNNKQGIVYAGAALATGNTSNNAILVGVRHQF